VRFARQLQDKGRSANMSIADVYSVIKPTNARIYYEKSDCNITQNQRHYFFGTALLNGEEYANKRLQ
jgi:hypothetical protein